MMAPETDKRVNYDQIAPTYDKRYVADELSNTAKALLALAESISAERVLEVGCGTAHWLAHLDTIADQLHGLDFSPGMLGQAQQREQALRLVHGRAGQLPYAGTYFDLVYCVNAIHHFQQKASYVSEARRLLRPGGALAIIGMDPKTSGDEWYIYDYFEGTLETDLARFPSWGTVMDWMLKAGFEWIELRPVERIFELTVGRAILDNPFLQKDSCSQLALLSEREYATGLQRIETALAAAEAAGETITFPSEITLEMLIGWVRD
jgi:SAM-dependent methyltransferase